jgi:hypothetical protein
VCAFAAASCAAKPERATVDEFFAQSKLLDRTALQHIATVVFDPQANGIVERFEITSVSEQDERHKTVAVLAQVKLPDGAGMVEKSILLTLAKGAVANDPAAAERWIVTGFIERPGKLPTPRS